MKNWQFCLEKYIIKVRDKEYPGNGGPRDLGIFRIVNYKKASNSPYYTIHSDSFICAMEFGNKTRAKALLSHGNSSEEKSPYSSDKLKLFSSKQLRDVWFT